ncbi:MAG: hypothetical protein AB7P20_16500 [Rhizobiaceae bacterium]
MGSALLLSAPGAQACELGNVFGQAARDSSNASAQALDGLISIFSALRSRELRNIGAGQENLGNAAQKLFAAARDMRKVEIAEADNISLARIENADLRQRLGAIRARLAQPSPVDWKSLRNPAVSGDLAVELTRAPPDDLRQLYRRFAAETELLGVLAANLSKRADVQSILPELAPAIVAYIWLGDSITRVPAPNPDRPRTGCSR